MKKIYFSFLPAFFALHVIAQQTTAITHFMQYCETNFRFNGVVLIAEKDKIIYKHAYGKANEETNINNTLDTKFRLASISKQFTAFIVLQLVRNGSLSLDDHLAKFINVFNQPDKQNISIRNLLTHTSGLAEYTDLGNFNDKIYYSKDSIINMIAAAPLFFPPSSAFGYSNSNFFLLAVIIKKLTGKNFTDVLEEMVLKKAGMLNSGEEGDATINEEAKGYIYRNDSTLAAPFIEMKNAEGGGGMYSTAEDLLKWSLFFQHMLTRDTILKNAVQPFILSDGTQTIYSCGWCLMPNVIFHTGHINGFANLIAIDTIHHQTIILLTNDDYRQLYITMQSLKGILQNDETSINWIATNPANDLKDYRGIYSIGNVKVNIKDTANFLKADVSGQKYFLRWYKKDEFFLLNSEAIVKFERNAQGDVIAQKSFEDYSWTTLIKE